MPINERLSWMLRGNPDVIGTQIDRGDIIGAAYKLDNAARAKGLKIVEIARFRDASADVAFARGIK